MHRINSTYTRGTLSWFKIMATDVNHPPPVPGPSTSFPAASGWSDGLLFYVAANFLPCLLSLPPFFVPFFLSLLHIFPTFLPTSFLWSSSSTRKWVRKVRGSKYDELWRRWRVIGGGGNSARFPSKPNAAKKEKKLISLPRRGYSLPRSDVCHQRAAGRFSAPLQRQWRRVQKWFDCIYCILYIFFSRLKTKNHTVSLLRSIDISVWHWANVQWYQHTHKHSKREKANHLFCRFAAAKQLSPRATTTC